MSLTINSHKNTFTWLCYVEFIESSHGHKLFIIILLGIEGSRSNFCPSKVKW